MFHCRIESKKETKTVTLDEDQIKNYLPSFIIYQAKQDKQTTTTVIHEGVSQVWHIKYMPH